MSSKHQSTGTADERSDTEFDSFENGAARSRLAREAKIGLGVIFLLLVVFAVVFCTRLPSADEDPAAAAAASEANDDGKPAVEPFESGPSLGGPSQPTFLAAKAGTNLRSVPGGAVPQAPSPNMDSWRVMAEDGLAREKGAGATSPAPPSLTPNLVTAMPADRYAGYRGAWEDEPSGSDAPADNEQPSTPSQYSSTQAGSSGAPFGMPKSTESAGPDLPGTMVDLAPPPSPQRTNDPYRSPAQQAGSLWGQTAAGGSAVTVEPAPYSDRRGYAFQSSEPLQGDAAPAQMPPATALAGPQPTYASAVPPSKPTQQVDASAGASGRSDTSQQWRSGAVAAQSGPSPAYAPSETPALRGLGGQYAAGISSRQDGTYVVQPNDNYWVISERLYGTGAYFRALAHHNRAKTPDKDRLPLGDRILAPDASELEKAYPELCPKPAHREAAQRRTLLGGAQSALGSGRVYVVQEGDNLFDIARYELGKPTRWTEIVDLNKQLLGSDLNDLNYLTPGMEIVLPQHPEGTRPAGPVTRRPGLPQQR